MNFLEDINAPNLSGNNTGDQHAGNTSIADSGGHFTATDVEGALAELFTSVSDGKDLIATAITDKGGTADGSDTFPELADAIDAIPGGGGDPLADGITATFIAADTLQIGDIVYTLVDGPTYVGNSISGFGIFSSNVIVAKFSPDGSILVIGGAFTGGAMVCSVSGTTLTFVSNIYADGGSTALTFVYAADFSPSGGVLVLGGNFTGVAKVYSVSGTTITFVSNLYADGSSTPLTDMAFEVKFAPSGNQLVLVGSYSSFAKMYTVSGTTITFSSNISDVSGSCSTVKFSPSGDALVLGGAFTGKANVYSVSGTTVTFVSIIYADAGTTQLSGTCSESCFSALGNLLVLGGAFTGYAKLYSVSGTTMTYLSDIFAATDGTALSGSVSAAVFNVAGNTLILGGTFTGKAKRYAVTENSVVFVANLLNSGSAITTDVQAVAFSPDDTFTVVGGAFSLLLRYVNILKAYPLEESSAVRLDAKFGYSLEDAVADEEINVRIIDLIPVGTDTTDANAGVGNIVSGKTAYVNGQKLTGSLVADMTNLCGTLSFSGTYATATYYTAAGCSIGCNSAGEVFVIVRGGTSTSYENIIFALASAPSGVTLKQSTATYTHASNNTQNHFGCVLAGVAQKVNVAIALDVINATYDSVRAYMTVTNA